MNTKEYLLSHGMLEDEYLALSMLGHDMNILADMVYQVECEIEQEAQQKRVDIIALLSSEIFKEGDFKKGDEVEVFINGALTQNWEAGYVVDEVTDDGQSVYVTKYLPVKLAYEIDRVRRVQKAPEDYADYPGGEIMWALDNETLTMAELLSEHGLPSTQSESYSVLASAWWRRAKYLRSKGVVL